MRKILLALVSFALIFSLASCNGDNPSPGSGSSSSAYDDLASVTITVPTDATEANTEVINLTDALNSILESEYTSIDYATLRQIAYLEYDSYSVTTIATVRIEGNNMIRHVVNTVVVADNIDDTNLTYLKKGVTYVTEYDIDSTGGQPIEGSFKLFINGVDKTANWDALQQEAITVFPSEGPNVSKSRYIYNYSATANGGTYTGRAVETMIEDGTDRAEAVYSISPSYQGITKVTVISTDDGEYFTFEGGSYAGTTWKVARTTDGY